MTIHSRSGSFRPVAGTRRGLPEADIAILTPVFNDWDSLAVLIDELETALRDEPG